MKMMKVKKEEKDQMIGMLINSKILIKDKNKVMKMMKKKKVNNKVFINKINFLQVVLMIQKKKKKFNKMNNKKRKLKKNNNKHKMKAIDVYFINNVYVLYFLRYNFYVIK